jgi:hypothetical protein
VPACAVAAAAALLRRPMQDCQLEGEQRRDGTRGGRLGAMGWLKHSIPTGLSVTKAANILEMLRGNEVRCGNKGEY